MTKKKKDSLYTDGPECNKCKESLSEREIYIIEASCYSCESPMKVSLGRHYSTFSPKEFTKDELEYAKLNGVFIKENYSKTMEESYLSNTCTNCNSFVGNFYLFKDYFLPAKDYGELEYTTWKSGGFNCQRCDWGNN